MKDSGKQHRNLFGYECLLERLEELEPYSEDRVFVKATRLVGETMGHCD